MIRVQLARLVRRGVSRRCEQCYDVKRCLMYLDRDGHPTYLCARCARELEFTPRG